PRPYQSKKLQSDLRKTSRGIPPCPKTINPISLLSSLLYPLWYSRFIGGQAEYLTPRCPRSKLSIRISKRKGLALRCDSHYADADCRRCPAETPSGAFDCCARIRVPRPLSFNGNSS